MQQQLVFEGLKFISSKEAAKVTGYAKDYIGQICREGRVEARRIGRAWFVNLESVYAHRKNKSKEDIKNFNTPLITSEEKNKAIETISVENQVEQSTRKSFKSDSISSWYPSYREQKIHQPIKYSTDEAPLFPPIGAFKQKDFPAPSKPSLPTPQGIKSCKSDLSTRCQEHRALTQPSMAGLRGLGKINVSEIKPVLTKNITPLDRSLISNFQSPSATTSVIYWKPIPFWLKPVLLAFSLLLLISGGYQLSHLSVQNLTSQFKNQAVVLKQNLSSFNRGVALVQWSEIKQTVNIPFDLVATPATLTQEQIIPAFKIFTQSLSVTIYRSLVVVPKLLRNFVDNLSPYSKYFVRNTDEEPPAKALLPESKSGLVVVPAKPDVDNAETITQIKKSFSDEIEVYPDASGQSGIIRPVFRDRQTDDYLYVLVPIDSSQEVRN